MENEEMLKWNTDCVYFLASPFTCKKGAECEYRHSEGARLNPVDCWFWLSGSCLNPMCDYRHPPLEVDTITEYAASSYQSSLPPSKSTTPCYFYSKGRCRKGAKCTFLHALSNAEKLPETSGAKTSAGTLDPEERRKTVDTKVAKLKCDRTCLMPVTALPDKYIPHPATTVNSGDRTNMQQKQNSQQPVRQNDAHVLDSKYQQRAHTKPESSNFESTCAIGAPRFHSDLVSEEQAKDVVALDEWCESSPRVDAVSSEISQDKDCRSKEHIHSYSVDEQHSEGGYDDWTEDKRGISDHYTYNSDGDEQRFRHNDDSRSERDQESIQNLPQKRKFSITDLPDRTNNSDDLRNHLTKRMLGPDGSERPSSRRHGSGSGHKSSQPYRSLASRLVTGGVDMLVENLQLASHNGRGWGRSLLPNSTGRWFNDNRRSQNLPEVPKRRCPERRRGREKLNSFTGSKRPEQIKEGKSRGGHSSQPSRKSFVEFEGPRPLSDILREKKRKN